MWRYDFHLFYLAGQAVLSGVSPYTIPDFNPPYPLAVVFALVAWLPEPVAYALYVACCVWLLWRTLGRTGIWALLAFPVLFGIFVGQVDLLLTLLVRLASPWALPFLIVKPQVGFVLAPWLIRHTSRDRLLQAGLLTLIFLATCFLLRPTWVSEWLAVTPVLTDYARRDSNLYWLIPSAYKILTLIAGMLIAFPAGFMLTNRRLSWVILHLFAPLTNIYSVSVLAEWIGPVEVILSWIVILLVGDIHAVPRSS